MLGGPRVGVAAGLAMLFMAKEMNPKVMVVARALDDQLSLLIDEITLGSTSDLNGRSIRDANPRAVFGVTIIAVKSASAQTQFHPDPALVLRAGGTLISMGERTALACACHQPMRR